ncbi:rRNA maturation RNase YbeY [Sporolactobacillus vineae]|uniref:rRNA maturation RNase YbeY n=1 Tax=Sporolactobacillus vineae TaxID=444463 RepID=UPI000289179A|nr:rRNA maturation RNase YbeY [Sporolactobacillus vineae]
MTLTVDMNDETKTLKEEQKQWVVRLLNHAADVLDLKGPIDCSVTFVNNPRIQDINREYRGINRPTDVISFALEEMAEGEVPILPEDGEPRVLGDIIVSLEKAAEQADAYGHSFERELGFLVVHGLLHLLGYDHATPAEEKVMFGLQEKILSSYGLSRD